MSLNTRVHKREPVETTVEYAMHESTDKTIGLSIPRSCTESGTGEAVFVKGALIDISVGGCGIDSPYMVPPGVILDIKIDSTLFAAETERDIKTPIRALARVTSCVMKAGGRYRLGVCFTCIDKEFSSLIDDFIKKKDRRKDPRWDMSR